MSIENVVNKIIELGIDIGTKDAVKSALQGIKADTALVDDVYIAVKNKLNLKAYAKVPKNERALFLPQCLRNSQKCIAELTDKGYVCKRCGACSIPKILDVAEKLGYDTYIVPGGSMVLNIVKNKRPKAVAGVGCYQEVEEAIAKVSLLNIPSQGVPLSKDGCKDTEVDLERIINVLRI
ncbi:MAG: hypothetical protein AYK23_05040 [Candidatus Proteinoplasmatales archaeon SG8-5]|nr:MAG: hypothetical protein AYK23_05040 [Candidatus Proteinoplasmatales archaeon SG8-5]